MDGSVDLSGFVRVDDEGAHTLALAIDGITCAACIGEIETAMIALPGVGGARLNYTQSRLTLDWKAEDFKPSVAVERLQTMGYRAYPFELAESEARESEQSKHLLRCLAVSGFAAMNVMLLSVSVWAGNASDISSETRDMFHWISALIAIPAAAFSGRPFFTSAAAALRRGSLNMDVPISLGIILALGMSVVETALHAHHAYFDSALMLIFFLLTGRVMEQNMRRRTRAVAGNLAAMRALVATQIGADGTLVQAPTSRLVAGDCVLVRPSERIPIDGIVIAGTGEVDLSIVTGETKAKLVAPGDRLYAGALNLSAALELRVAAASEKSFLSEVERLLDQAAATRTGYVGLAERASRIYAPVVHLTALATCIGWLVAGASLHDSVIIAIAVLIITCPCALALAVPAVHVVASGALFRRHVLLNGGQAIERLAEADHIVFDKTGTLTLPQPRVANAGEYAPELLSMAGLLAQASRHPLARALADSVAARNVAPIVGARETAGQGVAAEIDGVETRLGSPAFCGLDARAITRSSDESIICFRHGAETAVFRIRQTLRPDAAETVARLRAAGYQIEILSGDSAAATEAIAVALGVTQWRGEATPADKAAHLEHLKAAGAKVVMIGDGFNDAPALAAAHASLSPITAADIAQASADAVFLGDRLAPVAQALEISRSARRMMFENLVIAVVYNAIAVPLAILGYVTPLIAALAMSGSSLIVTANALRLGLGRQAEPQAASPPLAVREAAA